MPETQIFENEEAAQFLDYFIAYKKLINKIEYIKCIAALNNNTIPTAITPPTSDLKEEATCDQPPINPLITLDR